MISGHIIFLNGTSSSGKPSIAKELQECLQEPYMFLSLDAFFSMYPEKTIDPQTKEGAEVFTRLVPGVIAAFHKTVAVLADNGNNLIVDHVLQEEEWRQQCVDLLTHFNVTFVGVKCPLPVLLEREKQRGDRLTGTAEYQFDRVHKQCVYDVEVDTSVLSVEQCTQMILKTLADPPEESAFSKMEKQYE